MNVTLKCIKLYRQVHSSNFAIVKASEQDREEILKIMHNVFYKNDPSSVYSKVAEIPVLCPAMHDMNSESIDERFSFVAKEKKGDKKIIGASVNGLRPVVIGRDFMDCILKRIKRRHEKTLVELWKYVSLMPPESAKYFKGAKDIFELRFLVVDPSHRHKGIATALVTRSKQEAAACGYKFMRVNCTSHFTARIASSVGMERIFELNYKDYKNRRGEQVFHQVVFPHTKVVVYAGKTS